MINQNLTYENQNRPAIIYTVNLENAQIIYDLHFHMELEFLWIFSGKLKLNTDKEQFILTPGDIIFINSNIPHRTESLVNNTNYLIVQFRRPSLIENEFKYLSYFFYNSSVPIYVFRQQDCDYNELTDIFNQMDKNNQNKDLAYDYYIRSNIFSIIAILYKNKLIASEQNPADNQLIDRLLPVFKYIENNYSDNISLEALAKTVNISKEHLCRLFKKATQRNISDYINLVRICKAEDLLNDGVSITEAAYNVGFSSHSYFNTVFKKYKLCSPGKYKKLHSNLDALRCFN